MEERKNGGDLRPEIVFVNKKDETKKARFPMEKESYKACRHSSVPKEWTERMVLEECRDYCRERSYQRRVARMPVDAYGHEIEIEDKENLTTVQYAMLMEEAESKESMMERFCLS